jgi:phosphoserine aminotransferase
MARVYNLNAGPATLPLEVLEEAQRELLDFRGTGMSVLEVSHRGKEYEAVHQEAIDNLRKILAIPAEYAVLFVQGGASLQFAMVPMNLLLAGQTADYVCSGSWAEKAYKEAKNIGSVAVSADTSKEAPTRVPRQEELRLTPGAAYVHITSNETIGGCQWKSFPTTQPPLVADMSSDFLSRPFDVKRFGLVYAGAQKNIGPAGVAVVIVRKDLMERAPAKVPAILKYTTYDKDNSLYNTPPCFTIYVIALVTRWVLKMGPEALYRRNQEKAGKLYAALDASSFYKPAAARDSRSDMNVTFRLPTEELEELFLKEASGKGLKGLKGHRSVGGIRASLYNAFPTEGVDALVTFMRDFEKRKG